MQIRCLFKGHQWKFAYNHGMPLGISLDSALIMFKKGRTYEVYQCTRCPKQSRLINGDYIVLSGGLVESP